MRSLYCQPETLSIRSRLVLSMEFLFVCYGKGQILLVPGQSEQRNLFNILSCPEEWLWTSVYVRKNAIEQPFGVLTKFFLSPTPTQLIKRFLDSSLVRVHILSSQFDLSSRLSSSRFFLISYFFVSNSYSVLSAAIGIDSVPSSYSQLDELTTLVERPNSHSHLSGWRQIQSSRYFFVLLSSTQTAHF